MAKILIIDDSAVARKVLRDIFEKRRHQVLEAANGTEGIRQYYAHKPDLVTMDILMPDMSGIEVVRRILSMDPGARIIMVTGSGKEDKVIDSITSGARGFILKPFDENKVALEVEKVLKV